MRHTGARGTRGFTLLEMLIVIGIIGVLVGLLLPVLSYFKRKAKETATLALITDVKSALENYFHDHHMMPLKPGSPTNLRDTGSGFGPLYYQTSCVSLGAAADGTESNKDLVKVLLDDGRLKVNMNSIQNGELVDAFGHPLIFRFMLVRHGADDAYGLDERAFIWSYGYDGKNGVKAQTSYTTHGMPNYDNDEADAMQLCPASGADDLTSWRLP